MENKFTIKKIDPEQINWSKGGKYDEVVNTIIAMKMNDGISVEGLPKAAATHIKTVCHKQAKGKYVIRSKKIGGIIYFLKTAK